MESVKIQKVPHLEGLSSNYSKLLRVVYKGSFPDAEMRKDILENIIGSDGTTENRREMV